MSSDQPVASEPPVVEQGDSVVQGEPFFSRPAGKIFIIWFAMTTVGVLIGIYVPHHLMPTLLSHEATDVWRTIVLFTILAAPVAAVVYAVAAYSLIGWRHRGNQDEPPEDGPPLRGNSTVTAIWLGTSTVLVLVLLAWGLSVYSAEETSHPNTLQIDVTGQQWLWTFSYPGTGVNTRSLVLPINRPVQFNVTSVDVTHGFWPAALGSPGRCQPRRGDGDTGHPGQARQLHRSLQPALRPVPLLHVRAGFGRDDGEVLAMAPVARGLDDEAAREPTAQLP